MLDPVSAGAGVGALATLSKPVEKLIEVTAGAIGKLYEPTNIRRKAKAEGDALVTLEDAKGREIAERARQRLEHIEAHRQINLESIVSIAQAQLSEEVSDDPVDPDWASRFFREAQDISNEEMRLLWAKLLAGEVAQPGRFSPRTITVVSGLTKEEAKHFEALCAIRVLDDGKTQLFHTGTNMFLNQLGMSTSVLFGLQAAGLLIVTPNGLNMNGATGPLTLEAADDVLFQLTSDTPKSLRLGSLSLTPAGEELASLVPLRWTDDYMKHIAAGWSQDGWKVTAHRIMVRNGSNSFQVADLELPFAL